MSARRRRRWLIGLVAALASALPLGTAQAAEEVLFGPHTYTRTSGAPTQFTETITLPPTLTDPFRLHVQNGTPDGRHQILGATIRLNGTVVASTDDFSTRSRGRSGVDVRPVAAFDRSVALRTRNTLQVSLTGPRGSFLILTLFGTIPPPRLTDLAPPTLRISQGATGTLTATLSAPQPAPSTIRVESDHPDVAAVPAKVTVPAGETEVAVPVTAGVRGTARITARLYGSHVHSTVIVTRARPTLTSLLPATLQLALGAAGRLTVTISAAQRTPTHVTLTSSNASLVSLPHGDRVTVPPGHTTASFRVVGVGRGTATITAALNGTTAESQVTVGTAPPAVVSLLPPVLPLTEGSTGSLTVTLNATQPTDTAVALHTSDATIVGLPGDSITIPADQPSASVSVTGLTRGTATVTAALNGSSASAAITVQPPAPRVQGLTCPATLAVEATATCTVTLNATQQTATEIPLSVSGDGILGVPSTVIVPADALTGEFAVTGLAPGGGTITAGPVTGTSQTAAIQVLPPPPTIVSLTAQSATLFVGATATLTLTLNAAQLEDTVVPVAVTPGGILSAPTSVTVPAGSLAVAVPVEGVFPGTATVTAGYLNGTQAQTTLTVNQLPPTVVILTPATLTLPKGKAGILTVTIAPTQTEATVVALMSSDPSVEVPLNVTVPAGAATADFPVLTWAGGTATITAGPLNQTSQTATVTVTPAELVTLDITPPAPTIAKRQTQQFTATGAYTDATTPDLTASATWTSDPATVATITSPGGLATGHTEGQVTITATVGAISDTAILTVTPPILASVALSPATPTVLFGQTLQLSAVGTLTDGTTQDVTAQVTWASGNPAVATITSPGGLATALAPGSATITATYLEDLTASTTLTVTLPPPTLTGFNPSSGKVGTSVTFTGTNFAAVAAVRFNGVSAPGFTVNSLTSITVAVPPGATTGPLAVTTAAGTATSTGQFIVLPTQDFQLSALPSTISVPSTGQGSAKISLSGSDGFTGLVTLAISGVPTGVSASFAAPTLTAGQSTLLSLQTSGTTPPDSYPLIVTATGLLNGVSSARAANLVLQVQPGGQTSLAGQVLDEDANPVQGAVVRLGALQASTDAAGSFLLLNPPAGADQLLLIDGGPASTPERSYPIIPYKVTIVAGVANVLGFTPHLHLQKTTGLVNISNTSSQRVVTDPGLPGFKMTIPAGVSITGWDGQPNTQVAIRKVPLDRNPLPPFPADRVVSSLYMYYFGKQGGGTPSAPVPITYPNDLDLPPGTQVELWYYDEAPGGSRPNAWAQYGTGTVSTNGSQVLPDTNPATGQPYGQPRFCCGAGYMTLVREKQETINKQRGGDNLPPERTCCGDPVEVSTGLFVLTNTDLVLPGRLPIVVTRTYRPRGAAAGPFGPGTSHPYHILLLVESDLRTLLLPGGTRLAFPRQADGTFRNTTDPLVRGAVLTLSGAIHTLRFKDGGTWTFGAPVFGTAFLVGQMDRNGNSLRLTRSGSAQNLVTITEAAGREITLTYDGSNRITTITDPLGRRVTYTYHAAGNLGTVTDPAGGITQYTYDSNGWMLTVTDPRGITVVQNEYDTAGRVIRQTRADGGIWTYAYTTAGTTTTQSVVTNPEGQRTTYRFTGGGYRVSTTDGLGQSSTTTRDPSTNQPLATTDALGRTTQFAYDPAGNVTQLRDPLGQLWATTYEPTFNQPQTTTDPLGNTTTFAYDPKGNLISVTDPLNHTTTFGYNANGDLTSVVDALNHTTTFEYDTVGNLIATIDPLGNRTERSYDAVSRLVALKDPKGAVTQFSYDVLDRLVSITDPLNGVTRFTYDPNGNLLTVTDARGNTTTHTYDPMNRLATRIDPLNRTESYTYDLNGNLKTVTDRKGQVTTHTYDAQDRRIRTDYADGSSIAFTYDPTGNLLAATDSLTGPITRSYDALNRLASEVTPQGAITYAYDQLSRRQAMQANGVQPVSYGYDAASRLTGITQGGQNAALTYDPSNRRTSLVLPNGITVSYTYDDASRLVAQTYTGPQGPLGDLTYTYDANGNRIATGGSWARTLLPTDVLSSTYDQSNEQLTFGGVTQTFDANGNVLTQTDATGMTSYTWDARNRLVGISGPTVSATFAYDALGRRIAKTISGQATTFHYDGLDVIQESGGAGDVSYLRILAIDEALTRTDAGSTMAYLADTLGSTVALATTTGGVATDYTYEPFGATQVSGSALANPFQFTGREDDGMGLYFYRARYYDTKTSRFLGEDPLGFSAGINFYSYAENNPVTLKDPLGLEVQVCHRPMHLFPSGRHTYLYSTEAGEGWGLSTGWLRGTASSLNLCVRGTIEPDRPYDEHGNLRPGHQCTKSEPDPCIERCVIRKARDQTRRPPRYCLGRYQCQDWAESTLRECRIECQR